MMVIVRQEMTEGHNRLFAEFEVALCKHPPATQDTRPGLMIPNRVKSSYGSTQLPIEDASLTFPMDKTIEPTPCKLYAEHKIFQAKVAIY